MLLAICAWVRSHEEVGVDVKGGRKELCFLLGRETRRSLVKCATVNTGSTDGEETGSDSGGKAKSI